MGMHNWSISNNPVLCSQASLVLDLLFDWIAWMDLQTAGVDHDEAAAVPVRIAVDSVAGGARAILDDGRAMADDPIEKSALADVWAPDDSNDGKWGHRWIMAHGADDDPTRPRSP